MNNIHIEMDNMAALSCLVKMGGMNNQDLVDLSKQIWNYLIAKQIILTAEHLTGTLNKDADFECENVKDKGLKRMMLNREIFQRLCSNLGNFQPRDRPLASSKQLKKYISLHKKPRFPLRISSVNVTKSAGNCGFGHIY